MTEVAHIRVECKANLSNLDKMVKVYEQNISNALTAVANAVLSRSKILAPMSGPDSATHGNLRNSGRYEKPDEFTRLVIYGNGIVPYARYQEFGGDGKRVVRNYTTPGTQAYYLRDASDSVAKEGLKKYL